VRDSGRTAPEGGALLRELVGDRPWHQERRQASALLLRIGEVNFTYTLILFPLENNIRLDPFSKGGLTGH
jgi:hypothetical protein